jgi:hypothetical protein
VAIKSRQFALVQNTPTNLVPPASFSNLVGHVQDTVPVQVKNEDSSAIIWLGGPDVSDTRGQSLGPGETQPYALYANDYPYAYTTSASSPIVSVQVLRQG